MSGAARDAAELAVLVAGILADAAIPYAIGGAIAYGFWGNPRGTRDLDVNLFVVAENAGPAVDALAAGGIRLDRRSVLASAAARGDARVFYESIPIDLFFLSIPFHESVAQRVVDVTLPFRVRRSIANTCAAGSSNASVPRRIAFGSETRSVRRSPTLSRSFWRRRALGTARRPCRAAP